MSYRVTSEGQWNKKYEYHKDELQGQELNEKRLLEL